MASGAGWRNQSRVTRSLGEDRDDFDVDSNSQDIIITDNLCRKSLMCATVVNNYLTNFNNYFTSEGFFERLFYKIDLFNCKRKFSKILHSNIVI